MPEFSLRPYVYLDVGSLHLVGITIRMPLFTFNTEFFYIPLQLLFDPYVAEMFALGGLHC